MIRLHKIFQHQQDGSKIMPLSSTSFPTDPSVWSSFRRDLRTRTRQDNWTDPGFAVLAKTLYSTFTSSSRNELQHADAALSSYFELVRMDWGLQAVIKTAEDLSERGANLESIASGLLNSCKAGSGHALAVESITHLISKDANNPIISLRLGQALAATGEWEALDSLALATVQTVKYGPWALEQWARLLLDSCRFDAAEQFVSKMKTKPETRRLFELRLKSFEEGIGRFPFPTFLINLDREPRKLHLSMELLKSGGYDPIRMRAIDGRQLPQYAHEKLAASPKVYAEQGAGAIATALSHINVWEQFLSSQSDIIMVVEDDAVPYIHWSYHKELLDRAEVPELLWANERMSAVANSTGDLSSAFETTWSALGNSATQHHGIGADGYILSRRGAEILLDLFDTDGIQRHVDWQMGAYSIGTKTDSPTSDRQTIASNNRKAMKSDRGINSLCFNVPLITANDHGVSNTTDISREYRERKR